MIVEVLVGPIASGKSTYAAKRAREGYIVINDDAIVTAMHGGDYTVYDPALKPLYKGVEWYIFALAIELGRSVVVDRTNMDPKGRQRWIKRARAYDIPCVAVLFPNEGPVVHAQRRYESDPRGLFLKRWQEAALEHQRLYVEPSKEEGFSDVVSVSG